MTAKRVTIGVKPTLVHRETTEFEAGEGTPEHAAEHAPVEPGPSSASATSIEDWLRNGETSADEKAPAAAEEALPPAAAHGAHASGHAGGHAAGHAAGGEAASAAAPLKTASRKGSSDLPPWLGIVGGAAAGALVAAAAAILMPRIMPVTDARLVPLAERVTRVETDLRTVGERMGKLNNEMAQSLDDQSATSARIDEQGTEIGALKQAVTEQSEHVDPSAGIDSPVFSVALGQLRTTFYAGRPFEAELMNVYALAGNNDLFSGYLTELMAPARTGVPNAAELHRVFPSYVAAAGLHIGMPDGYYQYGMSLVNRYVMPTESYKLESANLAVTRANRLLAAGDVGGAVNALNDIDMQYSATMTPWLDAARSYLRNETAITEMTRIVVDRLREKIARELPPAEAAEPVTPGSLNGEPATLPSAPAPEAAADAPPAVAPDAMVPVAAPAASVDLPPAAVAPAVVAPGAVPAGPAPAVVTP